MQSKEKKANIIAKLLNHSSSAPKSFHTDFFGIFLFSYKKKILYFLLGQTYNVSGIVIKSKILTKNALFLMFS